VQDYDAANPKTHEGMNMNTTTAKQLYEYFGLDGQTIEFIGHSIALYRDDTYLSEPALDLVLRTKLYHDSLYRFEGTNAPYIYPRYGLGELPQVPALGPPHSMHLRELNLAHSR
jgi:Rab GDP dissociation inhibitor